MNIIMINERRNLPNQISSPSVHIKKVAGKNPSKYWHKFFNFIATNINLELSAL
jgi:hypothetical protein